MQATSSLTRWFLLKWNNRPAYVDECSCKGQCPERTSRKNGSKVAFRWSDVQTVVLLIALAAEPVAPALNAFCLFTVADPASSLQFAVIGGGISGLTAAYRLRQLMPQARTEVFESSDRLGGVLATHRDGDLLIERGADSFITKQPWALELCQELGIAEELIPTNSANRRALVLRNGQLYGVPEGFVLIRPHRVQPILRTPLLSWRGKVRLLAERRCRVPADLANADFDDNLAHFATARLGREAFERLVEPLVAGIYTADASKLSVAATMPETVEALRTHGMLWNRQQGKQEAASGARYGSFVTPRGGVIRLIEALAKHLPADCVHLEHTVSKISRAETSMWKLQLEDGKSPGPFDGVVLALPTIHSARLLNEVDEQLATLLNKIEYASSAVVSFAFEKTQIARPLDGFGFVVPRVENRDIVAASFSSVKFLGRATEEVVLVRVFLGGALRPELVELPEAELQRIALAELVKVLGISGAPQKVDVMKWQQKMPQYHVGHVQLVDAIEQRAEQLVGLALAGNGYRGVGIPYCVRSGDAAARKIAQRFVTI